MSKKTFFVITALIIIGVGGYWLYQSKIPAGNGKIEQSVFDPKNAAYMIDGDLITLVNGKAEKEIAPGGASKIEVMVWGEPVIGDLGVDAASILTYSAGGSGTFFYVVGASYDPQSGKTIGTNAILLGDRIAPQNISISNGEIMVNYADRKVDEPMSVFPSVGVTRTFKIQGTALVEIIFCIPEQRDTDFCFQLYDPVCAKVNIQCIKAPCEPVYQNFSNPCEACKNSLVESYISAECAQ